MKKVFQLQHATTHTLEAYSFLTLSVSKPFRNKKLLIPARFIKHLWIAMLLFGNMVSFTQPQFQWAKSVGGIGYDDSRSIATDAAGNVYTLGYFQDTADFDPGAGTYNLTGGGSFICKLDASGNFVWAIKMTGSTSTNISPNDIAVDAPGNIYVTGNFAGTVDLDPGDGVYNLTSIGTNDNFICKLDAAGNFIWAKNIGNSNGYPICTSIAVDALGNVHTTGYFAGTVDFNPGPDIDYLAAEETSFTAYIFSLDASGNFLWAKALGRTDETERDFAGNSIAVDPAGNVYTTGYYFRGVAPGSAIGNHFTFVSKQDAAGNFVWVKREIGASQNQSAAFGRSVTADASGNVCIAGTFSGSILFDTGSDEGLTATGGLDVFVCKWDASGAFQWARRLGSNNWDEANSIAANSQGETYTLLYEMPNPYAHTSHCYKLSSSGTIVWNKPIDYSAIAVQASGDVYTTGSFSGTVDFDPGEGVFILTAKGSSDVFIAKWNESTPLPLTLLNFAVSQNSSTNLLTWQTASEQNTSSFSLERSANGSNFTSIGSVAAAGNSSSVKSYSFADVHPLTGTSFYRLKMLDKDGAFTCSKVVAVNRNAFAKSLQLFPSPVHDVLQVLATGSGMATLQITDGQGRMVKQQKVELRDNSSFSVDVSRLPAGKYYLMLYCNGQKEVQGFVKH